MPTRKTIPPPTKKAPTPPALVAPPPPVQPKFDKAKVAAALAEVSALLNRAELGEARTKVRQLIADLDA